MSTRTIVELNHDFIDDLKRTGHISREFFNLLCEATSSHKHFGPLPGVRVLGQRHHTETLELTVE